MAFSCVLENITIVTVNRSRSSVVTITKARQ